MLQSVIVSIFLAVITGHPAAGSVFADRIARSVIIKDTTQLLPSYDYVIVGSGAAGLTVADRLSENSNGAYISKLVDHLLPISLDSWHRQTLI